MQNSVADRKTAADFTRMLEKSDHGLHPITEAENALSRFLCFRRLTAFSNGDTSCAAHRPPKNQVFQFLPIGNAMKYSKKRADGNLEGTSKKSRCPCGTGEFRHIQSASDRKYRQVIENKANWKLRFRFA